MLVDLFHLVLLVKYIVSLVEINHFQSTDLRGLKGSCAFLKEAKCDMFVFFSVTRQRSEVGQPMPQVKPSGLSEKIVFAAP